jgi:hypothetical protein
VGEVIGNRTLLWHGSRLTNYVGILSQGARCCAGRCLVSWRALMPPCHAS